MGAKDWFMKRTIKTMNTEEKKSMMEKMTDEFFASMTPEERKELMQQLMPQMMEKMMEGLTVEDRQKLMLSMMPAMMSQMFGGEEGIPSMMAREDFRPWEFLGMSQEGFKPWEFCPCGETCEKGFDQSINPSQLAHIAAIEGGRDVRLSTLHKIFTALDVEITVTSKRTDRILERLSTIDDKLNTLLRNLEKK